MKNLLKYVITFIIIIISFNVLLLISSLFPSSLIEKNVSESAKVLLKEGNQPFIFKYSLTTNNNYTDAIMINMCYSIDNSDPVFSYMSARKNYKKGLTTEELLDTQGELISYSSEKVDEIYDPVNELNQFLDSNVTTSIEYARYWHGYFVFLRILLIFFQITEIRYLLLSIFTILLIVFSILAWKKIGKINTIIFCFALMAYDYFFVPFSLEGAPIFILMMIACIIMLLKLDKIKNIYLYFFIIACISNFVDFLTVPLITLAMPLYIYVIYMQKNKKITLKQSIKTIGCASMIWGLGYGLTWISKWVIYDVIYKKGILTSAISQVLYRSSTSNYLREQITIFDTLSYFFMNNGVYLLIFIILLSIFLMISMTIFTKKYKIKFKINKNYLKEITPIIIISILPIIWYITLSNHTILHTHFVYKHMLIVLIGELICLKKTFSIKVEKT